MSVNGLSSRVSNAGSNGSSGSSPSGRKAPPPPRISGPAAAGSESLLDIPEQKIQGLLAVPKPPEALAPAVVSNSNGNSQTQEKNESRRSSSSSPGESTSKDKVDDDEEVKRCMAIIQQKLKVRADTSKSLHARLKKSEEKTRIKTRECEDLSSKNQELGTKCTEQSIELAAFQGQGKSTQVILDSLKEKVKKQNTCIEEQSAKIQTLKYEKEGLVLEKEGLQANIQEKDQQIEKLKRELDQERNDKDSIAKDLVKMSEQIKRKKLN